MSLPQITNEREADSLSTKYATGREIGFKSALGLVMSVHSHPMEMLIATEFNLKESARAMPEEEEFCLSMALYVGMLIAKLRENHDSSAEM